MIPLILLCDAYEVYEGDLHFNYGVLNQDGLIPGGVIRRKACTLERLLSGFI
jgi:hypothetical protein